MTVAVGSLTLKLMVASVAVPEGWGPLSMVTVGAPTGGGGGVVIGPAVAGGAGAAGVGRVDGQRCGCRRQGSLQSKGLRRRRRGLRRGCS